MYNLWPKIEICLCSQDVKTLKKKKKKRQLKPPKNIGTTAEFANISQSYSILMREDPASPFTDGSLNWIKICPSHRTAVNQAALMNKRLYARWNQLSEAISEKNMRSNLAQSISCLMTKKLCCSRNSPGNSRWCWAVYRACSRCREKGKNNTVYNIYII